MKLCSRVSLAQGPYKGHTYCKETEQVSSALMLTLKQQCVASENIHAPIMEDVSV